MNTLDLEDTIAHDLSAEIAKEIDFGIMSTILVEMGWHKVVATPMTIEESQEIDLWVEQHAQGQYHTFGLVWLFENLEDAVLFRLSQC